MSARILLAGLLVLGLGPPARAQQPVAPPGRAPGGVGGGAIQMETRVSIRVVPDPMPPGDSLTVGDPFWATVVSSGPQGYYLLPESVEEAYRARPELAVLDSDRRDGRLRLRLALFRVGDVVLPEARARVIDAAGDTLPVPILSDTVRVASVLAPGDTLLADIKPLWEPETLPAWIWWAIGAALLSALLVAWWWRRRARGTVAPVARAAAAEPYDVARARIDAAARRVATAAQRIEAAAEIGDALRDYLADAWRLPARERTTFELLPALPSRLARHRAGLGAVFADVDLAKFARVAPDPERLEAVARRGVEVLDRMEAERRPPQAGGRERREAAS